MGHGFERRTAWTLCIVCKLFSETQGSVNKNIEWQYFIPTYNLGALSPPHGGLPTSDAVKTLNNGCLLAATNNSRESHPLLTFNFYFDFFNAAQHNTYFICFIYVIYSFISLFLFAAVILLILKERGNVCGLFFLYLFL